MRRAILKIGELEVEGVFHPGWAGSGARFELTGDADPNAGADGTDDVWKAVKVANFKAALLDPVKQSPPVLYYVDSDPEANQTVRSLYLHRIQPAPRR